MHFYNKYLSGQWTDSRIILDDGRKFDVHKIVLSTVPYFDSLFSAEGMNESNTGDVELHNVSSDIMEALIEYIYKRESRVNSDNAAELFIAADMLQISQLVGKCLQVMLDKVDVDNCVELLNMAEFFDAASCLHAPVLDFICRGIKKIPQESLNDLTKDSLISILSREQIAVEDEMILFRILISWVAQDEEERSRDLHQLLKLIRFGTLSSSNCNHIIGHPIVASKRKCRKLLKKFIRKAPHEFLECQILRTPISFVLLSDDSDVAIGYRKHVNGWSYCNFSANDSSSVSAPGSSAIRLTDGKYLYTILSCQNPVTDETVPSMIQTDFSTRESVKLKTLPFSIAKDHAACCYEKNLYIFNGIRKGESCSLGESGAADAFKYDLELMSWSEISLPDDVVEPFNAFGHRGKIYLAQQYTQYLYVLDADTDTWTRTALMARPHVRAMYAANGDYIYVIGGAKSCREVEKFCINPLNDLPLDQRCWTHSAPLPKHVFGPELFEGKKKLLLNFIGAALTFEEKIYIFLDSREMYFDYSSPYLSEEENGTPSHGAAFVLDETEKRAKGEIGKWLPFRFAPIPFLKPFVFINNLDSFITGSDDYQ